MDTVQIEGVELDKKGNRYYHGGGKPSYRDRKTDDTR